MILVNKQYVQCCMESLGERLCLSKYFQYLTFYSSVPAEHAICGTNITLGNGQIIPATDIPCHQIESFYTWHPLKGINLDILMLFIDGLLYFLFIGNQINQPLKK